MMLHGDCLKLLPRVATGSVDMVFADLPYGVTANKWDSVIPFEPLWAELLRVGKRNAAFVFTATQPFATALINSQPNLFKSEIIWDKGVAGHFAQATYRVMRYHENIMIFSRGGATYGAQNLMTYNPQMVARASERKPQRNNTTSLSAPLQKQHEEYLAKKVYTHRHPRSILPISSRADKERGLHPTQKPVALLEWLIRTYTNPGEVVLDPTAGSGTTLVACANTGRRGIGIEKDAAYFATAQARLDRAHLALRGAA